MKRIINVIIFFLIGISVYGQVPTWSVNENDFEYTMSFVAFLNIDGVNLTSTNDMVAAFAGTECRGVTNLVYVPSKNRYYAYFNVFSNTNGESLSFKVYDATNDKVVDIAISVIMKCGLFTNEDEQCHERDKNQCTYFHFKHFWGEKVRIKNPLHSLQDSSGLALTLPLTTMQTTSSMKLCTTLAQPTMLTRPRTDKTHKLLSNKSNLLHNSQRK